MTEIELERGMLDGREVLLPGWDMDGRCTAKMDGLGGYIAFDEVLLPRRERLLGCDILLLAASGAVGRGVSSGRGS